MSWGGIDLVRMLPGETRYQAVARAYADATFIVFEDGEPLLQRGPGPERDHTRVTKRQWAWMEEARRVLEELTPGWEVVDEYRADGRRWPWNQVLEHATAPMWVELDTDALTLRNFKYLDVDEQGWRFWWRVIRRFADLPCAVYENDESALVATSMSARKARERYGWM